MVIKTNGADTAMLRTMLETYICPADCPLGRDTVKHPCYELDKNDRYYCKLRQARANILDQMDQKGGK